MAVEAKRLSVWDTLRVQWYVSVPAFLLGLVVPNRRLFSFVARRGGGARAMRFLRNLRDKYACDHLWVLFFRCARTLIVMAPATIDDGAVLGGKRARPDAQEVGAVPLRARWAHRVAQSRSGMNGRRFQPRTRWTLGPAPAQRGVR